MSAFYDAHPYPEPVDDIDAYRRAWDDHRRRSDSHLFWPFQRYRDDRSILVAGCGTVQAAHYAVRWPNARVTGVDVSKEAIAHTRELQRKHGLKNLNLCEMGVERVEELGEAFDYVVCTGVLHHLPDPDAGLRALRGILNSDGALHLMVYAPYGRAGVYMLQEYCRRLGIGDSQEEIGELAASLKALPEDHPVVPLLRNSPDFASFAGLADALLHPLDRAYSVPEFLEFLARAGLQFGRWVRQAPYQPQCGALATSPHRARMEALPTEERSASLELFRGTMTRHSAIAYPIESCENAIRFDGDAWLDYVPMRLPGTITVRERLPKGATAVLINRNHTFNDLYLPIDGREERLLQAVDGRRTIRQIFRERGDASVARDFFERLWLWDQVVFDASTTVSTNR